MKTNLLKRIVLLTLILVFSSKLKSQVVINEVMFYPSGSQGLIVFNGNSGNEYVELYNPTCSPVNVAGYFIGSRQDFAGTISGGGFRIPNVAAATIPAFGHLVLGTSTSSSDPNSVDIKLPSYTSNYCQNDPAKNFILANADGWVALYNVAGTPVDAIYWTSSAGNISSAGDYGGTPCVPAGSPGGVTLKSPQQINAGFPGVLTYVGNTTAIGKTYSRMPDGGSWVKDVTPSINDLTVGNCNGGTCSSASYSLAATVVQPSCGGSNGSIAITPNMPGTYTYTWSPNVSTTSSASGLAANTYTITVDLNGCQKDTTITLSSGNGPTAIASTPTNPSCGGSNGQVQLGAVTGGTAPYQYNFNGAGLSSTTLYSNLTAGSYTIVVQDNNGCTYTAPNVVLVSGNGPTAIASTITNPSCNSSNGQVQLGAVTGGTAPYQYNFNGAGLSSTTLYSNLPAGSYTLVVQDNNGCSYTAANVVLVSGNGPTAIASTVTNPACNSSNGQVQLGAVTGGTAPYQYNFNGAGLSSTTLYSNLSAGSYTLVIQDNNGCSYTAPTIQLSAGNGPSAVVITPTNPTCGGTNGQVQLGAVTGGTAPYQYNFNGTGLSSTTLYSNLGAGTFTLVVQDNNGCSYTASNIVLTTTTAPTAISVTPANPSCGGNNGQVQLGAVTGGTAPYQYNFNGGGLASTTLYSNLAAGTYTLLVQDNNGCTFNANSIALSNSSGPTAISINTTDENCGSGNGQVQLGTVTGGLAPYQYNFNGGGLSANTTYQNLSAGNYSLLVQDANGCIYNAPAISLLNLSGPSDISVTYTDASCELSNGEIDITSAVGGQTPYTYSLNNQAYSSNLNYTALVAGVYTISVKDANACIYSENVTILNNPSPLANFTYTPPITEGGKVDITNHSSTDVITYSWIIPDGNPSVSSAENLSTIFIDLDAGYYPITLIVTNQYGCVDSVTKYIEYIVKPLIYVPNSFTPDGDDYNNTWQYYLSGFDTTDFNVRVFNRWGGIVWESNDPTASWDGTYKGVLVQDGVYTWVINAKDSIKDDMKQYVGHVSVLY